MVLLSTCGLIVKLKVKERERKAINKKRNKKRWMLASWELIHTGLCLGWMTMHIKYTVGTQYTVAVIIFIVAITTMFGIKPIHLNRRVFSNRVLGSSIGFYKTQTSSWAAVIPLGITSVSIIRKPQDAITGIFMKKSPVYEKWA